MGGVKMLKEIWYEGTEISIHFISFLLWWLPYISVSEKKLFLQNNFRFYFVWRNKISKFLICCLFSKVHFQLTLFYPISIFHFRYWLIKLFLQICKIRFKQFAWPTLLVMKYSVTTSSELGGWREPLEDGRHPTHHVFAFQDWQVDAPQGHHSSYWSSGSWRTF